MLMKFLTKQHDMEKNKKGKGKKKTTKYAAPSTKGGSDIFKTKYPTLLDLFFIYSDYDYWRVWKQFNKYNC